MIWLTREVIMAPNTCTCGGPDCSRGVESAACTSLWYRTPASRMVVVIAESVGPHSVLLRDCNVSLAIADVMWSSSASDDAATPLPSPFLGFLLRGSCLRSRCVCSFRLLVRASLLPPSLPDGTDEATLSCLMWSWRLLLMRLRACVKDTGVFGTLEELDLGTWHRQVVRTRVVEKLCWVRAPLVTDPALKLMILPPCADDVCVWAALSGTAAAFVRSESSGEWLWPCWKISSGSSDKH